MGGGHRSKVSGSTTVGGEERLGSDKLQGPPDAFFQMEDQPSMSGPKWGGYIYHLGSLCWISYCLHVSQGVQVSSDSSNVLEPKTHTKWRHSPALDFSARKSFEAYSELQVFVRVSPSTIRSMAFN